MTAPTLALDGVAHHYGSKPALSIERIVFEPGATAVLGPNGSGKSTLLRLLATVNTPQTGEVRLGGLDPTDQVERTAVRRRLGYVAQRDGLPPRMRVGEYCDYVGALKEIGSPRLRRRWTTWVLERVGLGHVRGERIKELSGGMQRRLSIAQALIGQPDLLVLDEPLAGLDAEYRAELTALMMARATDATVVVATHHADELATVCPRVVVIDRGVLVFAGTPAMLAARAEGRVWESDQPVPHATSRAVGPGRFRNVADEAPAAAEPVTPTVADGYLAIVGS